MHFHYGPAVTHNILGATSNSHMHWGDCWAQTMIIIPSGPSPSFHSCFLYRPIDQPHMQRHTIIIAPMHGVI